MNVCKTMIMLFQILYVNFAFQVEKNKTKNVDTINFTLSHSTAIKHHSNCTYPQATCG